MNFKPENLKATTFKQICKCFMDIKAVAGDVVTIRGFPNGDRDAIIRVQVKNKKNKSLGQVSMSPDPFKAYQVALGIVTEMVAGTTEYDKLAFFARRIEILGHELGI